MSDLSPQNFELLAEFLRKESGIVLKPEKAYTLRSKLQPLAQKWGYQSLDDLVSHVYRERHNPDVVDAILNALTIKETSFFRDQKPFEVLRRHVLPELAERRGSNELKLWSAACSTGQEAISLAIALYEALGEDALNRSQIVGTDVSKEAILKAKEGVYTDLEMKRGVDPEVRKRYFQPEGEGWRPNPELLRPIRFREMNLLQPDSPLPRFDVVLCRNVLIYFDEAGKQKALKEVRSRLADDGYLFTGAGEDAQRVDSHFKRERIEGVQCFRKQPAQ
jgi:chemotaxis protein methyltransferase CheR